MNRRPASFASSVGLLLGAIALVLAAVHSAAGPFKKPQPVEKVIAEKALSLYDRAMAMLEDDSDAEPKSSKPPVAPEQNPDQILSGATAGLGALAVALGVAGFTRRENLRACGGAIVLGTAALPWGLALSLVLAIAMVSFARRLGRSSSTRPDGRV
jgi:hypothetical protein